MRYLERGAFLMAYEKHKHQIYGSLPYLVHLRDVVSILRDFGHDDEVLFAAAWLHDVIEDTDTNYHDVQTATCPAVADIVYDLTDELGKNRKERKERTLVKVAKSEMTLIVKLADWISNVQISLSEHDVGKTSMYRQDFPEFETLCRDYQNHNLEPMWAHLSELLNRTVGR